MICWRENKQIVPDQTALIWDYQDFRKECVTEKYFSYFSTKSYVVGTQKDHLNEMVLLSTQYIC